MRVGIMPNRLIHIDVKKKSKIYVEVKCIFIRINQIDTVRENYYSEVFIQSKWREPLLDNETSFKDVDLSKFWNPRIFIENAFSELKESISLQIIYRKRKQKAYIMEKRRVKGIFRETLELQQFPFDCQELSVIVSTQLDLDQIELVQSSSDISNLNYDHVLESQEWELHSHVDVALDYVLSDKDIGPSKRQIITFSCHASRRFKYFVINHLMISSLLSLMAFCSFAIIVSNTFYRLQVCMVNLLTSVTFKVALSQNLPKISYLTYLDKAVLANMSVIVLLCFWHTGTSIFFVDITTDASNSSTLDSAATVGKIQLIEQIFMPMVLGCYIIWIILYGISIYIDAGGRRREMKKKDKEFKEKLEAIKAKKNSYKNDNF